jgi:hypothetical protein
MARSRILSPGSARLDQRWLLLLAFLISACTLLSPYDPTSYKNATDLKAASLALLEHGNEPYADHKDEIGRLDVQLRQAFEYEHGKGKTNSETAEQWKILLDKQGGLLGGTLEQWRTAGHLSEALLPEISKKIGAAFDEIIGLEQAKVKK